MTACPHIEIQPRGLRRVQAARYLGLGTTKFDELVAEGRMPRPKRIDGCIVWDRHELDMAFDDINNGGDSSPNPWDAEQ